MTRKLSKASVTFEKVSRKLSKFSMRMRDLYVLTLLIYRGLLRRPLVPLPLV
jgi:hypothetical protein